MCWLFSRVFHIMLFAMKCNCLYRSNIANLFCSNLKFIYLELTFSAMSVEEYERSWEQNEELGLNDMDTSSADVAYEPADTTIA